MPQSTTRKRLIYILKDRWRTEAVYQEFKQQLGLGQYQGRLYPGLQHHLSAVICTYAFIKRTLQLDDAVLLVASLGSQPGSGSKRTPCYDLAMNTDGRGGKPTLVAFSSLSRSLRRRVIASIILVTGKSGPMIIDEPGDLFDNEDIGGCLASLIKQLQDRRQIVFATGSSNLAINSAPDNYIVLDPDGGKLKKLRSGFAIDNDEQRERLMCLVEGSIKSFRQCDRRYTLGKRSEGRGAGSGERGAGSGERKSCVIRPGARNTCRTDGRLAVDAQPKVVFKGGVRRLTPIGLRNASMECVSGMHPLIQGDTACANPGSRLGDAFSYASPSSDSIARRERVA